MQVYSHISESVRAVWRAVPGWKEWERIIHNAVKALIGELHNKSCTEFQSTTPLTENSGWKLKWSSYEF